MTAAIAVAVVSATGVVKLWKPCPDRTSAEQTMRELRQHGLDARIAVGDALPVTPGSTVDEALLEREPPP